MANHKLIFEEKNLIDIPFEILITAHWRPQDAQLKKEFKKVGINAEQKEYQRLNDIWKTREVWINYCLELLYLSTPKNILSEIFNAIVGTNIFEPLSSYTLLRPESLKKWTGIPDFILKDDKNSVIFGEIKIAALKANHKYSFQQYQKYMLLSILYMLTQKNVNCHQIRHIVILPYEDITDNLIDCSTWKPELNSNILKPFYQSPIGPSLKNQFFDRVNVFLSDKNIYRENNLNISNFQQIIKNIDENIITHFITWSLFLDIYKDIARGFGDLRILSFVDRLKELTNKKFNGYYSEIY